MSAPDSAVERRALRFSIAASSAIGAVGIVVGLAADSQTIVLDGAYAFVGVVVSWLALLVSRLVARGPTKDYPYGREALTPLVVGIQGFVLLAVVVYAGFGAVQVIADGGADVEAGVAFGYAVGTTLAAVWSWHWLARRMGDSDLVRAEVAAWRVSCVLGAGMVAGFGVLLVLRRSSWSDVAPYVDPVMLLVLVVALVPAPLAMVRTTFVELLEGAPAPALRDEVTRVISAVHERCALPAPDVQMTKVGTKLYVDVEGTAPSTMTIGDEQRVRDEIEGSLDRLPLNIWLSYHLVPAHQPGHQNGP